MQFDDDHQFERFSLATHNIMYLQSVGGVYCLLNMSNGKRYVGKSDNLYDRLKMHRNEIVKGGSSNRGMRYDIKRGKSDFTFTILCYTDSVRSQDAIENHYMRLFCAWDSRFGYNDICDGRWTPEASLRDHERKCVRARRFQYLPGLDLDAPMVPAYVYSCAVGRGSLNTLVENL